MPRGNRVTYHRELPPRVLELRSEPEAVIARELDEYGESLDWGYEDATFELTTSRLYTPDFRVVTLDTGKPFYVEFKGEFTSRDRTKTLQMRKQRPDIDLRFVFQRNNYLNKNSRVTYEDWCIDHGFRVAIGSIPKEWIQGVEYE